ncbi:hypothetical protein [Saccharothrix syringae]|uniref:Uncharacterized protein n=1 Tax=Saccharothrix syringae TaxID=103733 RepID=A0A5Q0H302_SACSY|nr:hypothetical protein [Saccharothrix syringae]QFZ20598.1 hypothetical protein EKG83_27155 [Saccharothrix syringae]
MLAQERHRLLRSELTRVRGAATAWRNALAGLLVALIGFGLVKGRSDIGQLDKAWAIAVGALLLVSLLVGVAGALSLVRAANGSPSVVPMKDVVSRLVDDHKEAQAAAKALRRGIGATLGCVFLLVAAVGLTWYGPPAKPPVLQVNTSSAGTVCGPVVRVDKGTLVLKTEAGEVVLALAEATSVQPVAACPVK